MFTDLSKLETHTPTNTNSVVLGPMDPITGLKLELMEEP